MLANDSHATRHTAAIARLGLLERAGDPALTGITRLASYVSGAAGAAVHVLDDAHQHRVAGTGAPLGDHPREDSMCRLVVDSEQRIVCAEDTVARIERALAEPVAYRDQRATVGVSVGGVVATPGEDIRSLLRRADEAMYARKAALRAAA
jgi:hypothetical protein